MITVGELVDILKECDYNLPVTLVCDHGQEVMKMNGYGQSHVISLDDYMLEEIDEEEWEGEDLKKVLVLEAN